MKKLFLLLILFCFAASATARVRGYHEDDDALTAPHKQTIAGKKAQSKASGKKDSSAQSGKKKKKREIKITDKQPSPAADSARAP